MTLEYQKGHAVGARCRACGIADGGLERIEAETWNKRLLAGKSTVYEAIRSVTHAHSLAMQAVS